jgi:hypothetical protein
MSWQPIAFMIFTMGGVFTLNVLCIVLWIRAPKPAAPAAKVAAAGEPEPPAAPPADDAKSPAP